MEKFTLEFSGKLDFIMEIMAYDKESAIEIAEHLCQVFGMDVAFVEKSQ